MFCIYYAMGDVLKRGWFKVNGERGSVQNEKIYEICMRTKSGWVKTFLFVFN